MFPFRFSGVFVALFVAATVSATAQVVRSGNLVTCEISKGCTQETIDGRKFYVLETSQLVVKVAVNPDAKYNHFAVALENRSDRAIQVSPSDFRVEVNEPKFKRLSYIEPDKLKLPKGRAQKPQTTVLVGKSFVAAPAEKVAATGATTFLASSTLAPAGSVSGEVFFEREGKCDNMSLLLPIGFVIYEFPIKAAK